MQQFESGNFVTRIVGTVLIDMDFKKSKIFEFENKGLTMKCLSLFSSVWGRPFQGRPQTSDND